jgi:ATP-dependent DNA helicase RecQ
MALNTFSNGLRLVCIPKKEKKVACVVLHIAGGTQSEKNYQSGISDYLTKIMLMGTKDDTINRRFIDNAFPSEYDMNRVLRYIERHPKKGLKEIAYAIPFPKNSKHDETEADEERVKQILSLLSIDEAISKNSQGKYMRTSKPWTYDAKDIHFRREQRLTELREFNEFTKSSKCYMRQIRTALGESTSETCGRCANCQGHHFFE